VIYALYFLHVVVCIFLILVVLLQQGKGADLSVFGGGSTMAAFGARGATTLLHKLTVASFVLFTVTTLGIAILQGRATGSSVMSGQPAAPAPAPAEPPAGQPATGPEAPPAAAPAPAPGTPPATGPQGGTGQPATGPQAPPAAIPPPPAPATPPPAPAAGG
jgi:preprotein translocase subunit SecG